MHQEKSFMLIWMPFASIEQREHPEFVTQPLVIAKDPRTTGGRG